MAFNKNKNNTSFLSKLAITSERIFAETREYLQRLYDKANIVFTPASPFGQILKVLSHYFEHLFFYLEDAQAENHPYTATTIEAIYGNAQLAGHNPTRNMAAIGEIRLKFKPGKENDFPGPYLILNNNIKLKCLNNNLFYTIKFNSDFIRLNKNNINYIYALIYQGIFEKQTLIGTGTPMQSFNLNINGNADHNYVKVFVNGELWQIYDSLYDMNTPETKGVLVRTGLAGGIDIIFGNGYFGAVPPLGALIEVEYLVTGGSIGTIYENPKDILFEFMDMGKTITGDDIDLNEFLIIDTVLPPRLGADREDYNFTKYIAPLASKSFVLAGPTNYEYFLSRYNTFSYIKAFNTVNDEYLDDDNVTYLFLLPDISKKLTSNLDYFNLPLNEFILDEYDKKSILRAIRESGNQATSSHLEFVDPIIKKYVLNIIIRYFEEYDKETIYMEIRNRLNDYFINFKRRDRIPKSDIISIIENIPGVDSVNVYFISEENETAIRNGFYIKKTFKVTPSLPFLKEGENHKKRFIFFNKQLIETKVNLKPGEDPMLGLDKFGDIIINENELPVIRGGWYDRYGTYYQEGPAIGQPSSLSVYFEEKIPMDMNIKKQLLKK